jgi:hypothetical protein
MIWGMLRKIKLAMMLSKFLVFFSFSYLILTIPIQNRGLFFYLEEFTHPYTNLLFESMQELFSQLQKDVSHFGHQLFSNSTPEIIPAIEEVKIEKKDFGNFWSEENAQ